MILFWNLFMLFCLKWIGLLVFFILVYEWEEDIVEQLKDKWFWELLEDI